MPAFLSSFRSTTLGACASCGAYGNSQHAFTCDPERTAAVRFRLGRMRRVRRDTRLSAAASAYERHQERLIILSSRRSRAVGRRS